MRYRQSQQQIKCTYLVGPLPPPLSGQSISFAMLCQAFRERGRPHEIIDFSAGRKRRDGELSLHRLTSLVKPICAALRLIGRRPGNVYLTNAQSWAGFLKDVVFIGAAGLGGHRIILHLKGGNYDNFYREQSAIRRLIMRRILALADRLVVLGHALTDMYGFVPHYRDKVVVVHNGLPEELPDWSRVQAAKRAASPEIRVLYLSNLIESKGYLDVLEAVRQLVHEHGLNVRADFCGEFRIMSDSRLYRSADQARADFRDRVEKGGLQRHVVWHGSVSGEHKRQLLACAQYFVLPTAYKYEGQPVSIVEAMAYGVLVISTAYRTITEMLDDGKAGIFVEPKSPEQIVEAVLRHSFNSRSYCILVEAARQRCAELFSRERHLDRMIEIITGKG